VSDDLEQLAGVELTRADMLWLIRRLRRADARVTVLEQRLRRVKRQRRHRRKRKAR